MGGKGTPGRSTRGERIAGLLGGRRRRYLRLATAVTVLTAGLAVWVAPVVGDGLNQEPQPASPLTPPTVAASVPQSGAAGQIPAGASASASRAATSARGRMLLRSRITKDPLVTEEGKGTFVGIKCPKGYKAISGGVISGYINLLISSSSPNNPLSGKYTPQTWWLTVTNADVDGQGGSLSWRGVVNCLSPVSLKRP